MIFGVQCRVNPSSHVLRVIGALLFLIGIILSMHNNRVIRRNIESIENGYLTTDDNQLHGQNSSSDLGRENRL